MEFLYEIEGILGDCILVGIFLFGICIIVNVVGGFFEGFKLKGKVLNLGVDWMLFCLDGCNVLDVWIVMEMDDGVVIYVIYNGCFYWLEEVIVCFFNLEIVVDVDLFEYYFCIIFYFEMGFEKYVWLNNIVVVGVGWIMVVGVGYFVY